MSSPTADTEETSAVTPRQAIRGHTDQVRGVVHLPGGQRIITCSRDGSLRLWDMESGAQIGNGWRDKGHNSGLITMALSPNGKIVASGSEHGTVMLWDVEMRKAIARWTGHTEYVGAVCWSPDGRRVVSGSCDGTARVWDVERGEPVQGLNPIITENRYVYTVSYSPNASKIATGGMNGGIKIWDAETGQLLSTIRSNHDQYLDVWSLIWASDEKKIIIGTGNGSISILDTTSDQTAILEGHKGIVWGITLFGKDRLLASTSFDRTARLWNLDTNLPVGLPLEHGDDVNCAAFSADGQLLCTACDDKNAYAWNVYAILKAAGLKDLVCT